MHDGDAAVKPEPEVAVFVLKDCIHNRARLVAVPQVIEAFPAGINADGVMRGCTEPEGAAGILRNNVDHRILERLDAGIAGKRTFRVQINGSGRRTGDPHAAGSVTETG